MNRLIETHCLIAQMLSDPECFGSFSIMSGHNGPYRDPETPLRNTAHWLCIMAYMASRSGSEQWVIAGHHACNELMQSTQRPMRASFLCRLNPEKDLCNGLIGQAWVLEGLIAAAVHLGRDDARVLAREVFFLHPWNEDHAIWRRVSVDGSYLTFDPTFNHQLWFAAIASMLEDSEATHRSHRFLDQVAVDVELYQDGVIYHHSRLVQPPKIGRRRLSHWAKIALESARESKARPLLYEKSVGYHAFNLYAFAILKQKFPRHPFWVTPKFKKMLAVTQTDQFISSLDAGPFGWHYNPSGLELAFVGECFDLGHRFCQTWIDRQFERTYHQATGELLTRDAADPATASCRLYEGIRLNGQYTLPIAPY